MKILYFFLYLWVIFEILYFFLYLWVIFALLDPDPATQINAEPDPQPCSKCLFIGQEALPNFTFKCWSLLASAVF
jgi:hypothetical protein